MIEKCPNVYLNSEHAYQITLTQGHPIFASREELERLRWAIAFTLMDEDITASKANDPGHSSEFSKTERGMGV